jgi:hypothetical protein
VQNIDEGDMVTAVWWADPSMTAEQALERVIDRTLEIEIVSVATRYLRSEGASFRGWIVRSGSNHTDPIGAKRSAMVEMRRQVREYFSN